MNDELYFKEELAILEFYRSLSLYEWKARINENEGAILSLIPFSNKARVKSIWAKSNMDNVFDLDYIVNAFLALEKKLKEDIESYFNIELEKFIKHIPYSVTGR